MASYRELFHVTCSYCHGGVHPSSDAKEHCEVISVEFSASVSAVVHQKHKNSVVRVVLAGGMVELYAGAVSAQLVLERYPGLCLATPDVFKRPHESLVSPRERLLPGQKFYLVPRSTVNKLQQKNIRQNSTDPNSRSGDRDQDLGAVGNMVEGSEEAGDCGYCSDESICFARDFYVSREKWAECFLKRAERAGEQQQSKEKKAFTPPFKKVRSRIGLLGGWKPSLDSVTELSP